MARAWRETPTCFACEGETLVGVLSEPATGVQPGALGVLIVVGGPQYRAGAHRMFVELARALATAGHVALRFDVRGMGDSTGEPVGFEDQADDIDAALGELRRLTPQVERVVLWGLCDGASSALLYLQQRHARAVNGLCMVNPWVRSEALLARTNLRHYYLQRLLQPSFWQKLVGGGVGRGALQDLRDNVQRARTPDGRPYVQRMLLGLLGLRGPVLLVQSGNDLTAREFDELLGVDAAWAQAVASPRVRRVDVPGADHTFSDWGAMERLACATVTWLADEVACSAALSKTKA